MQEFNKVSTVSNFIKQLLNTTYLPSIRTVVPGDYILQDSLYILSCSIINCTKSGYIYSPDLPQDSVLAEYYEEAEYTFGTKNDKVCSNFQSNCEGYDSITHEQLGKYLRSLRDMYGLNLLPLYNCFSNNVLPSHHIFDNRVTKEYADFRTKIYKVPIRFNTDYTVCIENIGETTIAPAFIKNNNLLKIGKNNAGRNVDITNDYISIHTTDVISTYAGLRFYDPLVVRFNNIPETRQVVKKTLTKTTPIKIDIDKYSISKYLEPVYLTDNTTLEDILYVRAFDDSVLKYYFSLYEPEDQAVVTLTVDDSDDITLTGTSISIDDNQNIILADTRVGKRENDILLSVGEAGIYYKLIATPKQLGWREKSGNNYVPSQDESIDLSKEYYILATNLDNSNIEYDITEEHCAKYNLVEDDLYMLIQVPASFNSNIVVLEGDYTNNNSLKVFDTSQIDGLSDSSLDKLFIHNLKLLRMNTNIVTPFSDTLMQFLLWNSICLLDTINLDFDRLRQLLLNNGYVVDSKNVYANYWYYKYREFISDFASKYDISLFNDNLGYVTTEIEHLLKEG